MQFDLLLAWKSMPELVRGACMTVAIVLPVLLLGMAISIPMAVARLSRHRLVSWPVTAFVMFFRGAPSLLILYFAYNGLAQLAFVREGPLWLIFQHAYLCAVFACTMNHAAYLIEILKGGLMTVPAGLVDAAKAMGLSRRQIFLHVKLPVAIRFGFKAYQNEVVIFTKSTGVVSAITVIDLTAVANEIFFRTYDPFTPILCAAALYWCIVHLELLAFAYADRKLNAHQHVAGSIRTRETRRAPDLGRAGLSMPAAAARHMPAGR